MLYRVCLFLLLIPVFSSAQVPPAYLREADVFFSKRVWRVIDLREKQNKKAVWPRAPVTRILYDAASQGKLAPYLSDSLRSRYTLSAFNALGSDTIYMNVPIDPNDPEITKKDTIITTFDPVKGIQQLLLMEDWYFDKKRSAMVARIIAIAPLYHVVFSGIDAGLQPLCWFRYYDPKKQETDCRNILSGVKMFNKENSRSTFTLEDWFEQRNFASFIVKVSNMHDVSILQDPEVKKNGLEALIKAESLKKENYENEANQFED